MRVTSIVCLYVCLLAKEICGAEECPVYKLGPRGYNITEYQSCASGCCGTVPEKYCCTQTVAIAAGTSGSIGGVVVVVLCCAYYYGKSKNNVVVVT